MPTEPCRLRAWRPDRPEEQEELEATMSRSRLGRRLGRRAVVSAIGGAAAAGTFPSIQRAAAQPLRKVTLTLSWVAEGASAYPYVARSKGYWSQAGLDVDIVRGSGSVAATQAVGAGRFDFGLSACPTPIILAAKGLKVVQIASCGYDSTMGVNVLADSPVRVPKDLEGRKLAVTPASGDYPFIPVFARKAGLRLDKVEMIQVDFNVRSRLLTERKVDAIDGYAVSNLPLFAASDVQTRFMLFSTYGMNFAGIGLITQRERIKSDPTLCKAMATGLLKGLRDCLTGPDEALELFFKDVPEIAAVPTARKQSRIGLGVFCASMLSETPKKFGLGYAPPAEYETMTDLVMEYVAEKKDSRPAVADTVTNEFIDDIKMSDAEWSKAAAFLEDYRRYLR
jgi:NitT/TauT family transport system substrate-binding protein